MGRMKSPTLVFFKSAALAQKQDGLGLDGRQQVHHGRGHGASHAEIEDRQVLGRGGLHGMVAAGDLDAEPFREQLDVLDEVTQKDELTEFLERAPGVPWQPISHDFGFGLHDVGTRENESNRRLLDGRQIEPARSLVEFGCGAATWISYRMIAARFGRQDCRPPAIGGSSFNGASGIDRGPFRSVGLSASRSSRWSCARRTSRWFSWRGRWRTRSRSRSTWAFVDYTTLERRRHFCEEEVRLNRRLAPSVYLGVVPVTRERRADQDGGRRAPSSNGR